MPWFDVYWLERAIEKVAEHGLSVEDVECVLQEFENEETSRSSGRPVRFGSTPDGRYIAVVFEWIDDVTVMPVTAYEID